MRAVKVEGRAVSVTDVPAPEGPGVEVQVRAAGICGSDLKLLDMGGLLHTPGHEIAGVLADGTAVAIEPATPCGSCAPCLRGDVQLCDLYWFGFYGVGRDGGMAERVMVEPQCLVPLAPGVGVTDASLVEPLAVAVHGMVRAGVRDGMRLAVVGAGTIGLTSVVAAQAAGCRPELVARHPHQQQAGEQLGASIGASGDYDVVVEAAGTNQALAEAVGLCRPGGTVLLLGSYFGTMELPGSMVAMREVSIVPGITYGHSSAGRETDAAAALLARRPEIAGAIITHRFGLEDAPEAFRVAADRSAGAIKVVLQP